MEAFGRSLLAIAATIGIFAGIVAFGGSGAGAARGPVAKGKGAFHVDCHLSHRLNDDPIVFFRGPGASHSHDFFGSVSTDAFSTNESLQGGGTTCVRTDSRKTRSADRSAYWVPTLYVGNQVVDPAEMGVYYSTGRRAMRSIEAFPEGLRIIAGDSKGLAPRESSGHNITLMECQKGTLVPGTPTTAPTCRKGPLELLINFPDCWDGVNLDSRDHKSHMAYSYRTSDKRETWACPSTHPRALPGLLLKLRYPTTGGPTLRLASGGANTAHADFMNGWDQGTLRGLVRRCLRVDKYCGGADRPVPGH